MTAWCIRYQLQALLVLQQRPTGVFSVKQEIQLASTKVTVATLFVAMGLQTHAGQ
jgi:hypothetical protein